MGGVRRARSCDVEGIAAVNRTLLWGGVFVVVAAILLLGSYATPDVEIKDARADAPFNDETDAVERGSREAPYLEERLEAEFLTASREGQNEGSPQATENEGSPQAIESATLEVVQGGNYPEDDDSLPELLVGDYKDPEDPYETPLERKIMGRFKDPENL